MMRIITGKAKGIKLETLPGDNTRPTAERAKEAVFSALQFEIEGCEVLDLFAGSGQLGLEALSRGAKHATLCDASKEAVKIIEKNTFKTRLAPDCTVFGGDYSALLRSLRGKKQFNMVFLDPPYALGLVPKALRLLCEYNLLSENAWVVCETKSESDVFGSDDSLRPRFELCRKSHYGIAQVGIFRFHSERSRLAIVPGSFDPMTLGHKAVVEEALKHYDRVAVAVMINPEKQYRFSLEERVEIAKATTEDLPNVTVLSDNGMLIDLYRRLGASAVCKGYRNQTDLSYEQNMAEWNQAHLPEFHTDLYPASPEIANVSSTAVRTSLDAGTEDWKQMIAPNAWERITKGN